MAGVRKKPWKSGCFQGWFLDWSGRRKFFTGTRNYKETLRMAERLEDEHRQVRVGYRPPPTLADRHKKERFKRIHDEYMAWGKTQGGRGGLPWSSTHVRNRQHHMRWWEKHLGLEFLSDLEGCLARAEKALRLLKNEGRSGKTIANYAEALNSFCNWCLQREYLKENPLKHLRAIDTTPVSQRRALTETEILAIFQVCEDHERILLETALISGLRANELRNLTIEHLDAQHGGLILDKNWTKNRKPGFQPLPGKLVEKLQDFSSKGGAIRQYRKHFQRKGAHLDLPDRPLLYVPSHMARMIDRLIAKAGIPKVTAEGKLDFHALRVAFVTMLIESGATVKEAQSLARHATPQITMNVYARVRKERLNQTVEKISANLLKDGDTM